MAAFSYRVDVITPVRRGAGVDIDILSQSLERPVIAGYLDHRRQSTSKWCAHPGGESNEIASIGHQG